MRVEPNIYLIGSGSVGFDMTDAFDCNIFLFDAGETYFCFDAGTGMGMDQILAVCAQEGLDVSKLNHLFLTHAHSDHGGGAAHMRDRLSDLTIYASEPTAKIVTSGDEDAVSLPPARDGGMFPADYVYRACPVDQVLQEGQVTQIGDYQIELIFTPGHSHDHHSYLVRSPEKTYLLGGDAIFFGGKIILQNTYDCDVAQSIASIQKLKTYSFDALLAGHLNFSLNGGMRHVDAALERIDQFLCPFSII
jgi:glyoxylase-like metal-dependent hydrolase (beta-lactamase superfamily II)